MNDDWDIELFRELATLGKIELTRHAARRCMKRKLTLAHISSAIYSGEIVDEDPEAWPNPTVTIFGRAKGYQEVELVCTIVREKIRVITVAPPKW